ncbi:ABC transporter ATP-binding protein [Actinomarinicola tropica]|uniref:ABC-type quaternary amine transporter n=1 Tax=Actinomarinicola tropica TaxID=2789776 RepID=A0A5Q2RGH9_9ACTN|nr:ABC transporter ATP-binding protein [Actinomarinicola tropica]QGG93711.1 ATP-binding cassette domain-containing protein [Actinomarinicola tropica]
MATTEGGDVAIRLSGVEKRFPGAASPAVTSLDLEVPQGRIVTFVGPSGCGKTTTLKMINRLIEPTDGTIEVLGRDVLSMKKAELRRQIGYVIQQIGLFPHKTVAANIGTVPHLLGWSKQRIAERVDELVDLVGLERTMLRRYPAELSGGQQQRVGVARALAADPPILLMDEPYSAVDPIVRARLQDELLALQRRVQKTIVLVTHDIDEAIKLGDEVVLFQVGGVVAQQGPPAEVLAAPASAFVEEFLGRERGLKRLALLTVADVALTTGWAVEASAPPSEALAVMAANALTWIGVRDGDRLLGWTWGRDLDGVDAVGEAPLHGFLAEVRPDTPLREALDGIVGSRTRVAVVTDDDGRYQGMLTVADISEGISPDAAGHDERG